MTPSALLKAVQNDETDKFKNLLSNESERMKILSKDNKGRTVLLLAIEKMNTGVLQEIMDLPEARQLVCIKDHNGLNCLHYLCMASKKQPDNSTWNSIAQRVLHWQEAAQLMKDRAVENDQNVLHYAAQQSNPIFLKTLLKYEESKKLAKQKDQDEKLPRDYASQDMQSQFAS
uniref:Uncharacterized protein n=1 Tax=Percolomonas cosmopolitus TaxID=63605 RepID=A0A7S1PFR5_9EUKA|mmetsp:Transcript_172/g.604  ORF Transcript_172/g.604 Transcript_172/m.604 type:complete len:173 (+) Transcript_172:56-574(+)|eukprot:CAMPEP_0117444302 /NCGR_PEP_ID=MMETSP0759-20121206/5168_1 /TAXON_ID=63605 /ORGANISM="Percolomonas cosmopolitus, Strain WS" /LENGTH=172 /DNA_ID=CAMNT_0005236359 /DNA_START=54 /DNA_END=572 /DNA_ORIENTATION=+